MGDMTGQAEALNNLSCALRMLGKSHQPTMLIIISQLIGFVFQ